MMGFYYFKGASLHVNIYVLLFPLLVVQMALLGLGAGMINLGKYTLPNTFELSLKTVDVLLKHSEK